MAAGDGVLLVMPTDARSAAGPASVWITAAGWAGATRSRYGKSWVLTPSGTLSAEETLRLASAPRSNTVRKHGLRRFVPTVVGTARKDVRQIVKARGFRPLVLDGPWSSEPLAYVWQHHEMFHREGAVAARLNECPLVLFVDAPVVWEAEQWNVRRPGWGRLAERVGERPQLRSADVVACVTEEVAEQAVRIGADESRVVVTPCGVDLDRFGPRDPSHVRRELGIEGQFVVGWMGTFHRFHGLDILLDAFCEIRQSIPEARLMLVGDGLDRQRVEQEVGRKGIRDAVIFTGAVGHDEVADYINAMDVAVVVDPGTASFHYSPLKLREYMACERPVIAPASGQVRRTVHHGKNALLVAPGDVREIVAAVEELARDTELAKRVGSAGGDLVRELWTWARQAEVVDAALDRVELHDRRR